MKNRMNRVNRLIKEKIADILLKEVNFFDVLATIQNVDTSRDLRYAKIGISIIPAEKSEEILKILIKKTPYIRGELGKAIKLKFIPKIRFEIDRGGEKAGRVEEILKKL